MGQAVETKNTNPQSGGVLNTIVGTGLGLLTANYNDRRQERLNKKYMRQQTADFNTSTPQQMKQWVDLLMTVGQIGMPTKKIGF